VSHSQCSQGNSSKTKGELAQEVEKEIQRTGGESASKEVHLSETVSL
jgi:hypothetical protein